jgi:hypothetical protein
MDPIKTVIINLVKLQTTERRMNYISIQAQERTKKIIDLTKEKKPNMEIDRLLVENQVIALISQILTEDNVNLADYRISYSPVFKKVVNIKLTKGGIV